MSTRISFSLINGKVVENNHGTIAPPSSPSSKKIIAANPIKPGPTLCLPCVIDAMFRKLEELDKK